VFNQEQVNEIVRGRLSRQEQKFYEKYGVKNEEELNALIEKGKSFDDVSGKLNDETKTKQSLFEENALLKNNIKADRYDDVKAYFKGKELEFNNENLKSAIETHPEWISKDDAKKTTITEIGNEGGKQKEQPNEKDIASKMFGFTGGFVR